MNYYGSGEPPPYEPYRKKMFHNKKERIINIIRSVDSTSLRDSDKLKLIKEIKEIVANY